MKIKSSDKARCEHCGRVRPFVLACAFQGDGTGAFRFLCASCERAESWRNQPRLFAGGSRYVAPMVEVEPVEIVVEPLRGQLALF